MELFIKGVGNVSKRTLVTEEKGKERFDFDVVLKSQSIVKVSIYSSNQRIEGLQKADLPSEVLKFLSFKDEDFINIPEIHQSELKKLRANQNDAFEKLLSTLKYLFEFYEIKEYLFRMEGCFWSLNNEDWHKLPTEIRPTSWRGKDILLVPSQDDLDWIQYFLANDFELLAAFRYLHKAYNENNPNYRWVDATIAAEWGIKEFLIRSNPELEFLLLKLPSPPLNKLYGEILENYAGTKFPKSGKFSQGAEKRNIIVHTPQRITILYKEAEQYIKLVEEALFFLLKLLHPKNDFFEHHYNYLINNSNTDSSKY